MDNVATNGPSIVWRDIEDSISWGDLLDLDASGGENKALLTRLFCQAVESVDGQAMTPESAMAYARSRKVWQMTALMERLAAELKAQRDKASPPQKPADSAGP